MTLALARATSAWLVDNCAFTFFADSRSTCDGYKDQEAMPFRAIRLKAGVGCAEACKTIE